MSIPYELTQKIRIILNQADHSKMYQWFEGGESESAEALWLPEPWSMSIVKEPGRFILVNPQVLLLRRLFASASIEEQQAFATALTIELTIQNARLVAHMIVELKDFATLRYWERIDEVAMEFWRGVTDKLGVEHWLFTSVDLDHVRAGVSRLLVLCDSAIAKPDDLEPWDRAKQMRRVIEQLSRVINLVDYARLESSLTAESNPVIDVDRRILLSRLEELGFSSQLPEALHEIERRGMAAANAFDFKTAMDLLRSFFEGFVQEAAQKVSSVKGIPAPTTGTKGVSYFASFKDYLFSAQILGSSDALLLQQVYNYVSNEASHALGSAPEQFRVAKVTVIEWCMLIAGRVQALASR